MTRHVVEARRSPLPAHLGRRVELLALTATIGVAALTRFTRLDLMEFKADEAEACRLALHVLGHAEPGVGAFFPTAGLLASVDVPNPPLFPYLLAAPLALVRSPLAAAAFVALANVVGVWLCYLVGKRYYSTFVGLCSAALLAASPWAIVYSRKIWAQDLLVPLTCLFLLALYAFVVEKRQRSLLWLFVVVAAATQLHFSAWVLAVVLAVALVLERDTVSWRWATVGASVAALMYAPYLWHLVAVGREAAPGSPPHLGSPAAPALAHLPLSVLVGGCALLGLVGAWLRAPTRPDARVRLLLTLWYVLPLAALTALPVAPFPHYFIILFPLPFLGFAFLLEEGARRRPVLAGIAAAACVALFAGLDGWVFATVREHGGAPADYGIAYRYKADAVRRIVRANAGRRIRLEDQAPPEYRFLIWDEQGADVRPSGPPTARQVVVESFDGAGRVRIAPAPR